MPEAQQRAGQLIVDPQDDADHLPFDTPPAEVGETPPAGGSDNNDQTRMSPFQEITATVVAVLVLVAIAIFYVYMVGQADTENELAWTRRMAILTGVEAIVFAAAGFLFGSQVQRRTQGAQTDAAKKQAAEAKRQARREELKAERERAAAATAAEKQKTAEIEGKQLAASVLTATEAAQGFGGGGRQPGVKGAIDLGGGRLDNLDTVRRLAQQIIDR